MCPIETIKELIQCPDYVLFHIEKKQLEKSLSLFLHNYTGADSIEVRIIRRNAPDNKATEVNIANYILLSETQQDLIDSLEAKNGGILGEMIGCQDVYFSLVGNGKIVSLKIDYNEWQKKSA